MQKKSQTFSDDRLKRQHIILAEYIKQKLSYNIKDGLTTKKLVQETCFEGAAPVGCSQYHSSYQQTYEVQHRYLLEDGSAIYVSLQEENRLELQSATDDSGVVVANSHYVYERGEDLEYAFIIRSALDANIVQKQEVSRRSDIVWRMNFSNENSYMIIANF